MTFRPDINSDLAAQALADEARAAADMSLDHFELVTVAAALAAVDEATEHLRRCTVRAVRGQGAAWEEVAAALGTTVPDARQRYAEFSEPRAPLAS